LTDIDTATVTSILGYDVLNASLAATVERAWNRMTAGRGMASVACANPHTLSLARSDPALRVALHEADVLLPDGVGVLLAGALVGKRFEQRVTGTDFFHAFSTRANAEGGVSYFFMGATEAVLEQMVRRMAVDYPNISVVGTLAPPFRPTSEADDEEISQAINVARPDVLWVGMSSGKQEKWIYLNRHRLDVRLSAAVGAVFDFYAGTKKRAPDPVRRLGLEWFYRLTLEPRRLWARNFVSAPVFLYDITCHALKTTRKTAVSQSAPSDDMQERESRDGYRLGKQRDEAARGKNA
jgi:N-acetylglucosaminyldiphosphoundecaprenol N-acetyl-beta-D-mannosaminyltransferase